MSEEERDNVNLIRISTIEEEEQQQRHPQAILQPNLSTISSEIFSLPKSVLDVLDDVYSNRTHRRCIDISYYTLLSMTLAVIFWIFQWLTYNRCKNLKDPQLNLFLCDLVIILETLTFTFLGISPFLFILMIFSWIHYSCYNPFDPIREKFVGFKLEGDQWKHQLDYYYKKKKMRYLNCFRCKQRKELKSRSYGYIILSPHGIIVDELILLSARKNIIDEAILLDNGKILKLIFKRTCTRPWKIHISIYLPEGSNNRHVMEELMHLLKIQINIDNFFQIHF